MKESKIPDRVIYRVAELFLREKLKAHDIAEKINREFHELGVKLSRESVYPLLIKARDQRFLRLTPPLNETMAREIEEKFRCRHESVRVIDCPVPESNESVSAAAAEWAFDLIKQVPLVGQEAVGVGLGPGRGTLDFVRHFSQLLGEDGPVPKLNLYAISAGCPADLPEYASISFFNMFPPASVNKRIGLFAETLVRAKDYSEIKDRPGIKEVFAAKSEIHIVVTSMGEKDDLHGLFAKFIKASNTVPSWYDEWVGDIQYRPFSVNGPLKDEPKDWRAVTLFELRELVEIAGSKDRDVILIARQCGSCPRNKTHAKALLPILQNPALRVFSKLVVDSETAREVLRSVAR